MKIIVGLGNPGEKYEKTRHNLGFMAVEQFLKDFESVHKTQWVDEKKFKSDIVELEWKPKVGEAEKVILVKPKTYMNNSGMAVGLIADFYKVSPNDVWVIYDDLDLPLGSMKIRLGGASAGHHGIDSLLEHLKDDKFWRFRLGIGSRHKSGIDGDGNSHSMAHQRIKNAEDFVISGFGRGEAGKMRDVIKRASKAIQTALEEDLTSAMNRFNTK